MLRAGKAVIEVGLLIKPIERQMRMLQARLQRVGQTFTNIGTFGGRGGFGTLRNLFIGSAAAAMLAYPVKLAANIEVATAQMSVFTGSAQVARDVLLELQEFSAISLIPVDQLTGSANMLMRFGRTAEQAVDETKALTVIAAGSTEEFEKLTLAFAQVMRAGKLTGEEWRQLKNTAFDPIREIAELTGETMDEVWTRMEKGAVSSDEVANALRKAVSEGGRFHGLLQKVSGTLIGQFNKALAQIRMAVLPIGEELLKPFTNFMKAVNKVIPLLADFIKKNVAWVHGIMAGMGVTVAAAVTFITLGLALGLTSIAIGGFASLFSALLGLLVVAAPVLLAIYFGVKIFGETLSGTFLRGLSLVTNAFRGFLNLLRLMVGGIVDAIRAGDFQLAFQILMAGLKAIWIAGLNGLKIGWITFKDWVLDTVDLIVAEIKKKWIDLTSWWEKETFAIGQRLRKLLGDVFPWATKISQQTVDTAIATFGSSQDRTAKRNKGMEDFLAAEKIRQRNSTFGTSALAKASLWAAIANAATKLAALRDTALAAAEMAPEDVADLKLRPFSFMAKAGAGAKTEFERPEGLFDTRLVRQVFGGPQQEQLAVLRKIESNTRKGGFGGFPAV
jgi:tape measure domain-containing protein